MSEQAEANQGAGPAGDHERDEREGPTGLERLVFFSDAVVAIAITLVALPLVDNARELNGGTGLDFLRENTADLLAAGISFAVIAAFWMEHHQLFDRATRGVPRLLGVNMLWLVGIVVLPVVTVVQVDGGRDRSGLALYLGTIAFLMIMSRFEEVLLARGGALGHEHLDRRSVIDNAVPVVLLLLALALALIQPAWGTLPLLLLVLTRPVRMLTRRLLGGSGRSA